MGWFICVDQFEFTMRNSILVNSLYNFFSSVTSTRRRVMRHNADNNDVLCQLESV